MIINEHECEILFITYSIINTDFVNLNAFYVRPPYRFPRKSNVVYGDIITLTSLVMKYYTALVLFYLINKFNFQIKLFPKLSAYPFSSIHSNSPGSE